MVLLALQLVLNGAFYCACLIYLVTDRSLKEFMLFLVSCDSGKNEATKEKHWVVIVKCESGKCS